MFTEAYLIRALVAAALLAPLCGLLGVFVTARRMSFFSDTIAHGALTGMALGVWLGWTDHTLPMVLFSLALAGALLWLQRNTQLLTDTIMALLLSGSVALGMIVLSLLHGSRAQLHSYLFGDILAVGAQDLLLASILFVVVFAGLSWNLSGMTLLSAHEEMAWVTGVPVRRLNFLFLLVMTITVAVSIRLLGILLVTALLVVPPATARNLSRNLRQQIIWSVLSGLVGGLTGVFASARLDLPCGPAIVLSCIALFIVTLVAGRAMDRKPRLHENAQATSPSA
jgi:zinc transport system permease protein